MEPSGRLTVTPFAQEFHHQPTYPVNLERLTDIIKLISHCSYNATNKV
jgi:hypothetical protein